MHGGQHMIIEAMGVLDAEHEANGVSQAWVTRSTTPHAVECPSAHAPTFIAPAVGRQTFGSRAEESRTLLSLVLVPLAGTAEARNAC
eukprot:scaffold2207_cov370-Prasinococcus_capsulatus_cf.AAC.11